MRQKFIDWIERVKMWVAMIVAWALPRRICYWCAMRIGANATQGQYDNQIVSDLKFMDAMRRWDE